MNDNDAQIGKIEYSPDYKSKKVILIGDNTAAKVAKAMSLQPADEGRLLTRDEMADAAGYIKIHDAFYGQIYRVCQTQDVKTRKAMREALQSNNIKALVCEVCEYTIRHEPCKTPNCGAPDELLQAILKELDNK